MCKGTFQKDCLFLALTGEQNFWNSILFNELISNQTMVFFQVMFIQLLNKNLKVTPKLAPSLLMFHKPNFIPH